MKKPKPIKIRAQKGAPEWTIQVIGYRDEESLPYLSTSFAGWNGYIEDRDVNRLLKWCEDCLKKRKNHER